MAQINATFASLLMMLLLRSNLVDGFSVSPRSRISSYRMKINQSLSLFPESTISSMNGIIQSHTLIAFNTENLRQYVPLAVICAVLIDIICGSPFANLLLAPMRRATESKISSKENRTPESNVSATRKSLLSQAKSVTSERIDTVAVAQAAVQKAKNALELRKYLDENKTDKDRMEDLRKKIDSQLRSLEE